MSASISFNEGMEVGERNKGKSLVRMIHVKANKIDAKQYRVFCDWLAISSSAFKGAVQVRWCANGAGLILATASLVVLLK